MSGFLMRLNGGPMPGDHLSGLPWPLPDEIRDDVWPGGVYRKTNESQLDESFDGPNSHILRGAEYEWVPDEDAGETNDQ